MDTDNCPHLTLNLLTADRPLTCFTSEEGNRQFQCVCNQGARVTQDLGLEPALVDDNQPQVKSSPVQLQAISTSPTVPVPCPPFALPCHLHKPV